MPEFGRVVAAFAPSATEKFLEFINARRSSVRSRPFRIAAGTQETSDGLTLNMQGKTDGLLTHSLAVQSNYFVVPIHPALTKPFPALPALAVSRADAGRLARGQAVLLRGRDAPLMEGYVAVSAQGSLVALAEMEKGELRPRRIFNLARL